MPKINKGSEWLRWDLHIHTPNTKLNDQYRDSDGNKVNQSKDSKIWFDFCNMLNESGIKCFGITDYFSVDNYLYLKKHREKFGLNDDIVLFPNVELRVSGLVIKGKNKSQHNHVNVHVIFSDEVIESQLNKFLSNLTVEQSNGETLNYRDNLNDLVVDNTFTNVPDYRLIKSSLRSSLSENYKDSALIMIPGENDGLANTMGTNHNANKDFMENQVDIIQTTNSKSIEYYLSNAQEVYQKYYPCVSGSDAHEMDDFLNYDKSKSTWIKAEPTFSGLKSIIYEPKNRVKISELNPSTLKSRSKIISTIKLPEHDFNSETIHFNNDLNVIIGGRSSGKSLLLSIIGMKASGEEKIKGDNIKYNELVQSKMEDTKLFLKDGSEVNGDMNIEFFYQDRLQEIARKPEERNNFIKNIIPKSSDIDQVNLELQEYKNKIDVTKIVNLKSELTDLKKELNDFQSEKTIIENINELQEVIDKIGVEITEEERNLIKGFTDKLSSLEKKLGDNTDNIILLNKLIEEPIVILNNNLSSISQNLLLRIIPNLNEEIEKFSNSYVTKIKGSIDELNDLNSRLNKEIAKIKENEIMVKSEENKSKTPELNDLNTQLTKEKDLLIKRNTIASSIKITTDKLNAEISNLVNSLNWNNYKREVNLLSAGKLAITYITSINQNKLVNIFRDRFKTGHNIYKHNVYGALKEVINYEEDYVNISENDFLESIRNLILFENEEIYKTGNTLESFLNDLSSLSYINKDYKIQFEDQDFDKMSEGKKAFVLLLIKLKIGENDSPILIDQPEDNLDNRSIAKDLVEYFKEEKIDRQMFIVTHNANVAIGSDSENIIIANEHDEQNPNPDKITYYYKNGSLEDYKIKEEVCTILEGGIEAFQARENRYNFSLLG